MTDKEKIKIMKEALESIAFLDEPKAGETTYWEGPDAPMNLAPTVAMDTRIARQALKEIRSGTRT